MSWEVFSSIFWKSLCGFGTISSLNVGENSLWHTLTWSFLCGKAYNYYSNFFNRKEFPSYLLLLEWALIAYVHQKYNHLFKFHIYEHKVVHNIIILMSVKIYYLLRSFLLQILVILSFLSFEICQFCESFQKTSHQLH